MRRTYGGKANSAPAFNSQGSGLFSQETSRQVGSQPWRRKESNIFNDSLDSPAPVLRQRKAKNTKLFVESDEDGDSLVGSQNNSINDLLGGMNKLSVKDKKENIDPFDQLFTNIPNKKEPLVNKVEVSFSSPEVFQDDSNSITDCGLFSSFSKEKKKAESGTPVLIRPKNYRRRTTKTTKTKRQTEPVSRKVHDDTLDVKIVFAQDVMSPPNQPAVSTLTNLTPGSCSIDFGRSRLVSSTPLITKSKTQLSSVESNPSLTSPTVPQCEGNSQDWLKAVQPSSLLNLRPTEDIKSPELERQHSTGSLSSRSHKSSLKSQELSGNHSQFVEEEEEEELVEMNCICDNNTLDILSVMCSYCGYGFHAQCCGLNEEDCNDLEMTNMTWACPRCRDQQINASNGDAGDDVDEQLFEALHVENQEEASKHERSRGDQEAISLQTVEVSEHELPEAVHVESNIIEEEASKFEEDSLSVTAQLEAIHSQECGEDTNASILFTKPLLPVFRGRQKVKMEVNCVPGKNWRRSMAQATSVSQQQKPARVSFMVIPTTPSVKLNKEMEKISESPEIVELTGGDKQEDSRNVELTSRPSLAPDPRQSLTQLLVNCSLSQVESDPTQSALSRLLALCTLNDVVSFENIYDKKVLAKSSKLGEGAFGEVFGICTGAVEMPVLKVVPVGGKVEVNGFEQTTLEDISSEVLISSYLSGLREGQDNICAGFVELRRCHVFSGKYPERLLELWDEFEKKGTENDRPDYFPSDQLYIALEYGNGGRDLEKFVFKNPMQAYQALRQVAFTLAVAEQSLQFEHRDLHWGNVLVKDCKEKTVEFVMNGETFVVETGGVKTQIIDFSLSRLQDKEGIVFKDLSQDPDLFLGKGEAKGGDFQFDCYRLCRENNGDRWDSFSPKSNIFWLKYIAKKMENEVNYRKRSKKTNSIFTKGLKKLKVIQENLLKFNSASDFVRNEID